MKTLAWGDKLCGEVITPESWSGELTFSEGLIEIVEFGIVPVEPGDWLRKGASIIDLAAFSCLRNAKPLYPPEGWAGKSDDDLWMEMSGGSYIDNTYNIDDTVFLSISRDGVVDLLCGYLVEGLNGRTHKAPLIIDPAKLVQPCRNLAVLQARLQGPA